MLRKIISMVVCFVMLASFCCINSYAEIPSGTDVPSGVLFTDEFISGVYDYYHANTAGIDFFTSTKYGDSNYI